MLMWKWTQSADDECRSSNGRQSWARVLFVCTSHLPPDSGLLIAWLSRICRVMTVHHVAESLPHYPRTGTAVVSSPPNYSVHSPFIPTPAEIISINCASSFLDHKVHQHPHWLNLRRLYLAKSYLTLSMHQSTARWHHDDTAYRTRKYSTEERDERHNKKKIGRKNPIGRGLWADCWSVGNKRLDRFFPRFYPGALG